MSHDDADELNEKLGAVLSLAPYIKWLGGGCFCIGMAVATNTIQIANLKENDVESIAHRRANEERIRAVENAVTAKTAADSAKMDAIREALIKIDRKIDP